MFSQTNVCYNLEPEERILATVLVMLCEHGIVLEKIANLREIFQ